MIYAVKSELRAARADLAAFPLAVTLAHTRNTLWLLLQVPSGHCTSADAKLPRRKAVQGINSISKELVA